MKSTIKGRVALKFGYAVLWQCYLCNTEIFGLLLFGHLLLATEDEKQDYIQLLSTRQSCWLMHTVVIWDRSTLKVSVLTVVDAATQRVCMPDQENVDRWRSVGCLQQTKLCSCRIEVFFFNFSLLRPYISFRMCHLFSKCLQFQILDVKCCWILLTQWLLPPPFNFCILILHEVITYVHFALQSDEYSTTLIFLLLKSGYSHTISLCIYEKH